MRFYLIPILFVVLLVVGRYTEELGWKHIGILLTLVLCVAGLFTVFGWPLSIYFALIVVLDIILILVIFKGDIRIR